MYGTDAGYSYTESPEDLFAPLLRFVWDRIKFAMSGVMIILGVLLAGNLGASWLFLALAGAIVLIVALNIPTLRELEFEQAG